MSILRDFFLGFVRIHILFHADREPVYGLALIEELGRLGYELSPGTLYPILHGMEQGGYLEREDRVVSGKVRKYYAITEQGRQTLAEACMKVRELIGELMTDTAGTSGVDRLIEPGAIDPNRIGEGVTVIDVRSPEEYAAGHVDGAINIPIDELESTLGAIPAGQQIITYCMMHHRGSSRGERAAELLRSHGIQASTLDGGLPGWEEVGQPVARAGE